MESGRISIRRFRTGKIGRKRLGGGENGSGEIIGWESGGSFCCWGNDLSDAMIIFFGFGFFAGRDFAEGWSE